MSRGQDGSKEKWLGFTWNVPNVLTLTRIVLVPVFVAIFLANPHDQLWRGWATAVFVIAILTDSMDGYIARKYDLITNFGKIWDSIADKALTGMAFIVLSIVGELPWWMTIIILAREWGITLMRFAVLKYGVMAANRGGKLKTLIQSFALIAFLAWLPDLGTWFDVIKWALMWAAFLLTVLTGIDYLYEAQKLRKASLAAGGPVALKDGSWQPLNQVPEAPLSEEMAAEDAAAEDVDPTIRPES